jgi:DNA-3-methyladenine glycosylase I
MPPYCSHRNSHPEDLHNRVCHDTEYGFPIEEDNLLFERLILEINQAGLSLITTLTKADNFSLAYSHFDIDAVAA